jgi:phosphate transport system substrate-binding protein
MTFSMTKFSKRIAAAAAALAVAGIATAASAADITGAGASFPYPLYLKWAHAYKGAGGAGLNYQSIGSGGGIAQIKAKTVTFGASDMPLKPAELQKAGLTQFPTVVGGAVPVVNVKGVGPGKLILDGPTLAAIFLGQITKWNDPAIAKLNPGLKLPGQAIAIVHRSDGSGTTFLFSNYLSKVSKDWDDRVGAGTSIEWPAGIGAKGNEGVAGNVVQTAGSIGYVELAYATQNHLATVAMINKSGGTVQPNLQSFAAAGANADWTSAQDFYLILTDQPGQDAWPISGATFILMHKQPADAAKSAEALKFFKWAYAKGNETAKQLEYVPLPANVHQAIMQSWAKNIRDASGNPVLQ